MRGGGNFGDTRQAAAQIWTIKKQSTCSEADNANKAADAVGLSKQDGRVIETVIPAVGRESLKSCWPSIGAGTSTFLQSRRIRFHP
jgi:hypothetical protein